MAQLDLSLSDALSDCLAPGPEPRVERDFVAQLEAEAFDDQIGETVGKTDYIPLLDGDGTAPDIGTALANGEKKAEGAQKPGSKVTATMQPGRPEPHGEVRPRVDPPDMASDLLSASMLHSPGPQLMGFSPMGASSGFMEVGVAPLPAERPEPQQHSAMLPEPQAPRGPLNLAPGASPLWSDKAPCPPADLPFTDSVSTVISRHANQLASDARPPRESGGDEKEAEASDRKQKKKKKRRQKDEGSWDQPEATEAPSEGAAPADDPYQRVGPRRDKGGPGGDGAWEEQIGKSGGRGKRGKSRKKLPEEWAATAEPFLPAGPQGPEETLAEVRAAAPSLPAPEEPFPGTEAGWSGRSQEFHPEEGLVPDPSERDLFSSPAPLLVQSSGLKATAAPFTMPAVSSPLSPGPACSLSATPHEHDDGAMGDELDSGLFDAGGVLMPSYNPYPIPTDPSVLSPASQLSPDQYLKMGASPRPTGPSDSSWPAGDSGDLFDLGDYPASLGCPFPPGAVLDATGPAPLRSPRTSAQDCRGPPREHPDEATANKKHRSSSSSSSSSSLKSPTFGRPPSSAPPRDCPAPLASSPQAPLGSPGSYLNPAAKPFFPGFNEPLEAPAVAPGVAPVMEDSQTPGQSDTKEDKMEDSMEDKMDDGMERLDEYVQLDEADRRSVRVEHAAREEEQEKHNKTATAEEKETEKEKQAEKVAEEMEDRVEKTPDMPLPADMAAKGVEEKVEKTIHVSGAHEDQETVVLEPTTPGEKAKAVVVTEVPEKPEAGDAKGTEVSKAPPSPEKQPTTVLLDAGSATPEKYSDKSTEDNQVEDTKVEKSKVEVTSVEDTKVEKSKVEVTSLEDIKVEESKVEVTSVEESKVEKSKVEVTSVEDTKVEKSKVEVTSVEDTKVEKSKVDVTSVEDTKVEVSKVDVTSVEDTKVEVSKMEVTSVEDTKVEVTSVEDTKVQEPAVSGVEKAVKTEEEALTEERHDEAEPERQQGEKPVAAAVETKDKAKEEVKKTAEKKEVKKDDSKEKAGKADAVTKKPSARPPTGSLKEPSSPEKKPKPAAMATKSLPATKARPVSATAPPTRRPASSLSTTTTTFNNSTSISAPLAKKTLASRPATAPTAGGPKRAPGLAPSRPSSSVTSTGPAPRDVRPKTTTTATTTTERRALGSKVTTSPAARPPAGPAPNRNGTAAASKTATAAASRTAGAARMTAAPRPALSAAAKKPLASKPDSKLAEDRKPGPLKTSADPLKPRTTAAARTGAPKPASASITERKTLVSRAPRPTAPSSSTTTTTSTARTSATASGRPASRPGAAPSPDPKTVRSKVGAVEKTKVPATGVKVSSTAQSKAAAAKDPAKVQILSKKVDLSKVTSKCGSKDNIKHKPGGGVVKIESHKVNFKDKAQSKVGSMDNLLSAAEKGDGSQEPAEEGSVQAPSVSAEQGPQETPGAAQENGLKEGGACGGEGLCDAPVLDTLIPETN